MIIWTHEPVTVVSWTADGPRQRQECLHCRRAWLPDLAFQSCGSRKPEAKVRLINAADELGIADADAATVISAACHTLGEVVSALELVAEGAEGQAEGAEGTVAIERVMAARAALVDLEALADRIAKRLGGSLDG